MRTIGILGGTGFVGSKLTKLLISSGYEVIIFSRNVASHSPEGSLSYAHWNLEKGACDLNALKKVDAIVNLAGAGVADKRWTARRKQEIKDSRVKTTTYLVNQLKQYAPKCNTFVAASAIGIYGADKGSGPFTEDALPATDFLGETCRLWEDESMKAANIVRTVVLRFGIVLGRDSGALPKMAMPLTFGVKPILGSGDQVMSWISIDDLTALIKFTLDNNAVEGIYNAVTPYPVTNRQFMNILGQVKGGHYLPLPAPAILLKLALGEMSIEVLKSCTADARKIQEKGFIFNHPYLLDALKAIYKGNTTRTTQ